MPNICYYSMRIQGKSNDVEEVVKTIKAYYNYDTLEFSHTQHLFRVFEADIIEDYEEDDIRSVQIDGECAWSVYSCMMSGKHTYYDIFKDDFKDDFRGTTLTKLSKETHTMIEVFSEEIGVGFQEHYLIKHGQFLIKESIPYYEIDKDELEEDNITIEKRIEQINEEIIPMGEQAFAMDNVKDEGDVYIVGGVGNWDFESY